MDNSKNSKKYVIAVDGEPGAGKGTLAKGLAKKFDMLYLDTGAMFRAVGYYFVSNNIEITDENIKKEINNINVDVKLDGKDVNIYLNNENITNYIRKNEVGMAASKVSRNKLVREKLVVMQRNISKNHSIVVDGQDMGTVVFKDADVKFFLVTESNEKARRRKSDYEKINDNVSFEKVKNDLEKRTYDDYNRKESPLTKAEDAFLIDNTDYEIEQTLNEAVEIVKRRTEL